MTKIDAPEQNGKPSTIWKVKLQLGTRRDFRYFQEIDDFAKAYSTVEELVGASELCRASHAKIVGIERIGRRWN